MPPSDRGAGESSGEMIAHFKVLAEIGQGGMGIVYKALDTDLGRTVALKVLRNDAAADDERRRRFLREARAAAAVSHANIAAVYEVGEVNGRAFIAMELVQGRSLRAALDEEGRPSLAEALRVARAVARALVKAHERGVVHRDLKPDNVMMSDEGEVKVLDFGLAKVDPVCRSSTGGAADQRTASDATAEGRILGTAGYMAPEQAVGKPVDARADQFAFGAMLFELVTGVAPFPGETLMETIIATTRDDPGKPSLRAPDVPAALDAVVERCLAKNADDRFATTRDLLVAIEELGGPRGSLPDADERSGSASSPRMSAPRLSTPRVSPTFAKSSAVVTLNLTPPPHARAVAPKSAPRASRAWTVPLVVAVAALGTGMAWRARRGESPAPIASATPLPARAEAERLYGEGRAIQARGSYWEGCHQFRAAADLDPTFTAPNLEWASCMARRSPTEARDYFHRAALARDSLSPRDRALVDALEPMYDRVPSDVAENRRRLEEAVTLFPGDSTLRGALAASRARWSFPDAIGEFEQALAVDPKGTRMMALEGEYQAYLGDFDAALRTFATCIERVPTATDCFLERAMIDQDLGNCARVEADTRNALAIEPARSVAYDVLANAIVARGGSVVAARELLRTGDGTSELDQLRSRAKLAMLAGSFDEVVVASRELAARVQSSHAVNDHAWPARHAMEALLESGRDDDASRVASEFLERRDAWEPDSRGEDWAIASDPTAVMLALVARATPDGKRAFAQKRAAWLDGWEQRVQPTSRSFLWVHMFAAPAETPDEARDAVDALARFPVPPFTPETVAHEAIGRAHLLAGDVDGALPELERATRVCNPLDDPYAYVRARFFLGEARRAKGSTASACEAYAGVVDAWGGAVPRSVTAERARAHMRELRCK